MQSKLNRFFQFLKRDIWRIPLDQLSPKRSFVIRQLRIMVLSVRGFSEDNVSLWASTLTIYTLLSIVPVLAVVFAVAQGFGLEAYIERELGNIFAGREDLLDWILVFTRSLLEETRGSIMAAVGLVVLFWSVMQALVHIESSFNKIWQVKTHRTFSRRFADYFSLMFIGPILVFFSSGLTVFVTTQIEYISENLEILGFLSPLLLFIVRFLPYLLIWTLFTLVYIIMPNTKVNFKSALIAGVIAGTIFILVQWAYIHFQIGVSRYNAIYGSFAALPLLIFWLQISWMVVLFGAEISFANQNLEHFEFERESLNMSLYNRKLAILNITHFLIKNFEDEKNPLTAREIANEHEMPIRLSMDLLNDLVETGIVSETKTGSEKEIAYQPAVDINKITPKYIFDKLDHRGLDVLMVKKSREVKEIEKILGSFSKAVEKCPENKLLKDI